MLKKILIVKVHIVSFLSFLFYFISFGKIIANPLTDLIITLSICTGVICCGAGCLKLNNSCCDCTFIHPRHSSSKSGYSASSSEEEDELMRNLRSPRSLSRLSIRDEPV